MSSKRLFSWSRRQSNAEPYYKTGGLLPIDSIGSESSSSREAKETQKAQRRPSKLTIIPPDPQQFTSSPLSSPNNVALVSSTSNLMAIFDDRLRSPPLSTAAWPRSASVHKPLPARPRSSSVPSTPDLPVELPGSLLQQNQGFPHPGTSDSGSSCLSSHNVRQGTHPPGRCAEDEGDVFALLHLFPEPLNHSKSVPSLNFGYRESAMKSSRSGTAPNANTTNRSRAHKVHHRRALSDIEWRTVAGSKATNDSNVALPSAQEHSNASISSNVSYMDSGKLLQPSPLIFEGTTSEETSKGRASRRDDLSKSATPTPTTTRSRHTEDLNAVIAAHDQTISTSKAQFGSLTFSHESHVLSLTDTHVAEVASLQNYATLLEEQLAQRPSLHHASSNNLLYISNTTESPTPPRRDGSQHTASTSASSTLSFRSTREREHQSSGQLQDSSDMESLKRKLSTTRRPQTADRNLLPELNQYKQNNVALQTQIGSLMAKLNESKKSEKALRVTLQDVEQRCAEAESKASEALQLASSAQALQNTIDHLENRLEIANTGKLDAQEELFNMRALKSPFDARFPELEMPVPDAHVSMDTIFSIDSHPGHQPTPAESSTLSTFVAHVEQLQGEIKQKEVYISSLEGDNIQLRQMLEQANQQCNEIDLQLDIQSKLLGKAKETDDYIAQLRRAVLEREDVIGEKEKSVRAVERQLEHLKLLLQAEIRKRATMARYFADKTDPLPELTALASKRDIDRWIQKLNQRLQKEKPMNSTKKPTTAAEEQIEDLRNEIDFYVREIIYYKLDIRGYKSDIKKLNRITAQLASYGNRASDLDSDTSSLRPAPTPSRARFLSITPEPKSLEHTSPALTDPVTTNIGSAPTPPPSTSADSPNTSPSQSVKDKSSDHEKAISRVPGTPQTPTRVTILNFTHNTPIADGLEGKETQRSVDNSIFCSYTSKTPDIHAASTHGEYSATLAQATGFREGSLLGEVDLTNQLGSLDRNTVDITLPTLPDIDRPVLERDVSGAPTLRPIVPTSRFSRDLLANSPSPKPRQTSHARDGSGSSVLSYNLQPSTSSRLERKLSTTSSNGIPFVIAMGSPQNPAIAVAAKNMPVTRHAPRRSSFTTSRAGVDGTMASSTPLYSPTSVESFPSAPARSSTTTGNKRRLSLSFRKSENESPTTPTHTRSLSGGSIRTAIRWTKGASKGREQEKEKVVQSRKDSVGMTQPLESPFYSESGTEGLDGEIRVVDFAASGEQKERNTEAI